MSMINVETKMGAINGLPMDGYTLFKGIPYAKPPVRELRWRPPQAMPPWKDVYKAHHFPNRCMQYENNSAFYEKEFYSNPAYKVGTSEDCLYLNIWTPAKSEEERLPVAFYIHGGAFLHGHCSEMEFDGAGYCKRGVILVTINYRCNIFGFLAHPWLSNESENGISGNYGIKDQIAALKWVYENISAFGGDPKQITIFGQSAGAMSVQTLISGDLTGNMISKAIMQSAGGYDSGVSRDMALEEALEKGEKIIEMSSAKSLRELRWMSSKEIFSLVEKALELYPMNEGLVFAPVIDGYVLPGGFDQLVDEDRIKEIPYMLGSTENDLTCTPEDIEAGVRSRLYHGCIEWSHRNVENGNKPSYVYYFSRQLPGDDAGAFHSSELWYMFETLSRCWRPLTRHDYKLSRHMMDYWTQFMKTGNPNATGNTWRPCTKEDPFVMELK